MNCTILSLRQPNRRKCCYNSHAMRLTDTTKSSQHADAHGPRNGCERPHFGWVAAEPLSTVTILFPPLCCWDNKWKRRGVLFFIILHIFLYDILYTVENLKKRKSLEPLGEQYKSIHPFNAKKPSEFDYLRRVKSSFCILMKGKFCQVSTPNRTTEKCFRVSDC